MTPNMHRHDLYHTDLLHPTLTLQILAGDKNLQIPALIDTGFDSYLCLPHSIVKQLKLEIIGEDEIEIANGQNYLVNICIATISLSQFDNLSVEVECIVSDDGEALFGTKLLQVFFDSFEIDFVDQKLGFVISQSF